MSKKWTNIRRQVVNPWYQTLQGQSVAMSGTRPQNILAENNVPWYLMTLVHNIDSVMPYCNIWLIAGISLGMLPTNKRCCYWLQCNDISHWLGAYLDWSLIDVLWPLTALLHCQECLCCCVALGTYGIIKLARSCVMAYLWLYCTEHSVTFHGLSWLHYHDCTSSNFNKVLWYLVNLLHCINNVLMASPLLYCTVQNMVDITWAAVALTYPHKNIINIDGLVQDCSYSVS